MTGWAIVQVEMTALSREEAEQKGTTLFPKCDPEREPRTPETAAPSATRANGESSDTSVQESASSWGSHFAEVTDLGMQMIHKGGFDQLMAALLKITDSGGLPILDIWVRIPNREGRKPEAPASREFDRHQFLSNGEAIALPEGEVLRIRMSIDEIRARALPRSANRSAG